MLRLPVHGSESFASLLLGTPDEPNLYGGDSLMKIAHQTRTNEGVIDNVLARLMR